MRISYNWLKEYVEFCLTPQQVADRLTLAGLEVEGLEYLGGGLSGVIVGRIASMRPHPDADKLTLCDVETGSEVLPIVCGAKNMKPGDRVPLAMVGAKLPDGTKIKKAALRGQTSLGMLCSEKELGLAKESAGLLILPEEAPVGEDIVKALGLDDWALEVNVTANRPDCLSHVGIAREVATLIRKPLRLPETAVKETGEAVRNLVAVEVEDAELCPRYAGRVIKGIKVGPSPSWMRTRLQAAGVRSINNVVDVTNYVLMELGHPLHAFDYDLLEDRKIIVRSAAEGEAFTTLDGVERRLSDGMLLICDGARPVALAGVMGGQNSEVTDGTKDIFIESAYFDPGSVRRTSKKVGLHTEASHRFERGADPEGLIAALDRAAYLIEELAGGKVATGRVDEYPSQVTMPEVSVRVGRVNGVLGAEPTFRPDITREADVVEEVARIYGYGKIKSALPQYAMTPRTPDRTREASRTVKEALRSIGYNEAINYSFINPADLDRFMLPEDDFRRRFITLQNPLTAEQSVMRTTLLPSLMGNLAWNYSRGVRDLKLFEISKVFISEGPGLPDEPLRVAGIAYGARDFGSVLDGKEKDVDYFDTKGAVEMLLDRLGVDGASCKPAADIPFMHPGKSAWLMVGGRDAGFLGQAHPDLVSAYDLPVDVYLFELDLQSLIGLCGREPKYAPLPKYPAVDRDVALILGEDVPSSSVVRTIESLKLDIIEDIRLFDYYAGRPIPDGKKSLAYTIDYRAANRTLTDEEVNAVHAIVVAALRDKLGAEVREQ
ncbi:MAG: phenylalanine--tRNA ligase subunit beta [Nitrospirae bacterium]|nr:phenylalanine--tRNA ligase subunit beta [Nitrospirota bacterium]